MIQTKAHQDKQTPKEEKKKTQYTQKHTTPGSEGERLLNSSRVERERVEHLEKMYLGAQRNQPVLPKPAMKHLKPTGSIST